jgi:hypothetical protein
MLKRSAWSQNTQLPISASPFHQYTTGDVAQVESIYLTRTGPEFTPQYATKKKKQNKKNIFQ